MLAKEVIEDSLISFLTQEAPNADTDGEPISQKVLYGDIFSIQECVWLLISWTKSCDEGSVKDKGWAIIYGIASKDRTHGLVTFTLEISFNPVKVESIAN